jgi:SAM-dependent methyltransferase
MADDMDYGTFVSSLMSDKETHFQNALRCLRIVRSVVPFRHVVDFGCGIGAWMAAAQWLGAEDVVGIDGPWVGDILDRGQIKFNSERVAISRDQIITVDLAEQDAPDLAKRFDMAMSIEVAEHLSDDRANAFCEGLVSASDYVLFSAATPGQGGFRHINEQPLGYWLEKFWALRYVPLDFVRPAIADDHWMYFWLRQNVVMFANYSAVIRNDRLVRLAQTPEQVARPWPTV